MHAGQQLCVKLVKREKLNYRTAFDGIGFQSTAANLDTDFQGLKWELASQDSSASEAGLCYAPALVH